MFLHKVDLSWWHHFNGGDLNDPRVLLIGACQVFPTFHPWGDYQYSDLDLDVKQSKQNHRNPGSVFSKALEKQPRFGWSFSTSGRGSWSLNVTETVTGLKCFTAPRSLTICRWRWCGIHHAKCWDFIVFFLGGEYKGYVYHLVTW